MQMCVYLVFRSNLKFCFVVLIYPKMRLNKLLSIYDRFQHRCICMTGCELWIL